MIMSRRHTLVSIHRDVPPKVVLFPTEHARVASREASTSDNGTEARLAAAIRGLEDRTMLAFEELALTLEENRTVLLTGRDRAGGRSGLVASLAVLAGALVTDRLGGPVAAAAAGVALIAAFGLDRLVVHIAKGGGHGRS